MRNNEVSRTEVGDEIAILRPDGPPQTVISYKVPGGEFYGSVESEMAAMNEIGANLTTVIEERLTAEIARRDQAVAQAQELARKAESSLAGVTAEREDTKGQMDGLSKSIVDTYYAIQKTQTDIVTKTAEKDNAEASLLRQMEGVSYTRGEEAKLHEQFLRKAGELRIRSLTASADGPVVQDPETVSLAQRMQNTDASADGDEKSTDEGPDANGIGVSGALKIDDSELVTLVNELMTHLNVAGDAALFVKQTNAAAAKVERIVNERNELVALSSKQAATLSELKAELEALVTNYLATGQTPDKTWWKQAYEWTANRVKAVRNRQAVGSSAVRRTLLLSQGPGGSADGQHEIAAQTGIVTTTQVNGESA